MAVYKRGRVYWFKFYFEGLLIRESAKTSSKTLAKKAEEQRRRELEQGYNNIRDDARAQRVKTIRELAEEYLTDYRVRRPRSVVFVQGAICHITAELGTEMLVDVTDQLVKSYQSTRLQQDAAPKTINEGVGILLRILGDRGDLIRLRMRRAKTLKLPVRASIGKPFSPAEKNRMLEAARAARSPYIYVT